MKRSPDEGTHEHKPKETRNISVITDAFLNLSLLNEKGICDRRNIPSFHVFVFVCSFIRRFLHFLVSFPFPFLFIELSVLQYFPFHVVSIWSFLYGSERWSLNLDIAKRLGSFERKILRKIFGATNIDNIWRKKKDIIES